MARDGDGCTPNMGPCRSKIRAPPPQVPARCVHFPRPPPNQQGPQAVFLNEELKGNQKTAFFKQDVQREAPYPLCKLFSTSTWGPSWRYFGCGHWGGGWDHSLVVEARDAVKHSITHSPAPPHRISSPNVNTVVEKRHSSGKMNVPEHSGNTDWTPITWRLLDFVTRGKSLTLSVPPSLHLQAGLLPPWLSP